ncbi:hypothetical protein OHD62_34250 [Mesorhizobium sp. YC-39]|nr:MULTISPECIES: hypothetical protein [unclassified Mesorhizobium]MCV3211689.1 hypothetical protein [Mesorhizobium sp. YC-2]MCV3233407.1 hypothetical protein [Mesorhizobium sp. YC-39]
MSDKALRNSALPKAKIVKLVAIHAQMLTGIGAKLQHDGDPFGSA